jgi:hypothetical protein
MTFVVITQLETGSVISKREIQWVHNECEALNMAGAHVIQGWNSWVLERPFSAREQSLPTCQLSRKMHGLVEGIPTLTKESVLERLEALPYGRGKDSWFYQHCRMIDKGMAIIRGFDDDKAA